MIVVWYVAGLLSCGDGTVDRLARVRENLTDPSHSSIVRALGPLEEADVADAIAALSIWPAELALRLERGLVETGRLRGAVLREACEGPDAAIARRLLVQQLRRSQARAEPFIRGEYARLDRVRDVLKLSPRGVLVQGLVPEGTPLPVEELLHLFEDAAVHELPFVVWPGALQNAEPVRGPIPLQSGEWLLHGTLRRLGLVPVRLLRATWVLPQEFLETETWQREEPTHEHTERQVRERLQVREARLFRDALDRLAKTATPTRAWSAVELLADLGLPCSVPEESRTDEWSRARTLIAALHRDPAAPEVHINDIVPWRAAVTGRSILVAGLDSEDPEIARFLEARRSPVACRETARRWLLDPTSDLSLPALVGLRAAVANDRQAALAAVLSGRLPYGLSPGQPTVVLDTAPDWPADASPWLVLAWSRRLGDPATDTSAPLFAMLESGTPHPSLIQGLVGPDPARAILRDILIVEAPSSGVRNLVEAVVQAGVAGDLSLADCRRALGTLCDVVASHAVENPLIASNCARLLREPEKESELGQLCDGFSAELKDLIWWTPAEGEWLLALDELGWNGVDGS